MKAFSAITTVYSYYLPEIRELITHLTARFPHDVFLRSISPGLDDFHHPIIDKLVAAHRHDVPALGGFAHRYPTAGAEEGIREYLTMLASRDIRQIYVWKGDYEGYREVAKTRPSRRWKWNMTLIRRRCRPGTGCCRTHRPATA